MMDITKKSAITLREITSTTVWKIMKLKTSDDQRQFVATNAESIAEAYYVDLIKSRFKLAQQEYEAWLLKGGDHEKRKNF